MSHCSDVMAFSFTSVGQNAPGSSVVRFWPVLVRVVFACGGQSTSSWPVWAECSYYREGKHLTREPWVKNPPHAQMSPSTCIKNAPPLYCTASSQSKKGLMGVSQWGVYNWRAVWVRHISTSGQKLLWAFSHWRRYKSVHLSALWWSLMNYSCLGR